MANILVLEDANNGQHFTRFLWNNLWSLNNDRSSSQRKLNSELLEDGWNISVAIVDIIITFRKCWWIYSNILFLKCIFGWLKNFTFCFRASGCCPDWWPAWCGVAADTSGTEMAATAAQQPLVLGSTGWWTPAHHWTPPPSLLSKRLAATSLGKKRPVGTGRPKGTSQSKTWTAKGTDTEKYMSTQ